jgi:uncharacterized delta-60 repeat protein
MLAVRGRRLRARVALCVLAGLAAALIAATGALAASWHLDSSFGKHGVAGLPLREQGIDSLYPAGPGVQGSLLAPGPQGSVFVGGYADHKPGSFLVSRLSARGTLVKSFGHGGITVAPAIHSTPQQPPRMLSLPDGKLLIVGLDHARHLIVVRLTARGTPDRSFGHRGVALYTLPGSGGHAILAAAAVESDGSILVAYYAKEAPQPVNEPRVAPGLGEGPLGLTRLSPSGALSRSFGEGGYVRATAQSPATKGSAVGVAIAAEGSILLAFEEAALSSANFAEVPAVQKLSPTGAEVPGFGNKGVAFLPFTPTHEGESSVLFGDLFALAGGGVETSFGGAGQLFRFTSTGTLDPTFGTSGHSAAGADAQALGIAPNGETFAAAAGSGRLTIAGTLASGAPDLALGAAKGERLATRVGRPRPDEEQQVVELLASNDSLTILLGEELLRVAR